MPITRKEGVNVMSLKAEDQIFTQSRFDYAASDITLGPLLAATASRAMPATVKGSVETLVGRRHRQKRCQLFGRVHTVDRQCWPGRERPIGPPMVDDSAS